MNELLLTSEELIPDIFFATHKFIEGVTEDLNNYFNTVKETSTQSFYVNYSQFLSNGWKYLKAGLGDLCVGLKAFGDKMASLGGDSFTNLGNTATNVVGKTGALFNFMDNLIIQINELMQENSDNSKFDEIANTITNYFIELSNAFKNCSTYTTHLYGDAKEVLGENFNNVSEGLLKFIQNVKLKCTTGIATIIVGIKTAYEYLSKNGENVIYNQIKLVNEDNTISNDSVKQLLDFVLSDLDLVKAETLKTFGI